MPRFGMHYLVHYMQAFFLPNSYLSFEHCNASVRILMNSLCCWSPRLWGSSRRVQWEQSIPERRPAPGWPRRQGSRWMRCCRWRTPFQRLPELTKGGQTSFASCESLFSIAPQSTLCVTNLLHPIKPSSVHTTPPPERFTSDVIVVLVDAYVFSLSHISSVV